MGAKAVMRAVAEDQVRVGLAADVKAVWVGECGLVSVGRGERDDYLVSLSYALAAELAGRRCGPAEGHDRRPPPQHLLDRRGHQRRAVAQVMLRGRVLEQRDARTWDAVAQRLVPRNGQQPEHVLELRR